MAKLLLGKEVSSALKEKYKRECESLKARGVIPRLAILRVGEKPDDISYERAAIRTLGEVGVDVFSMVLPEDSEDKEIYQVIKGVNEDPLTHGLLMFRPLSDKFVEETAADLLIPDKDVDGMGAQSLGSVFIGDGRGYPPCTAAAVMEIFDYYGIELSGKNVVVLGRSLVVGRPLSMLLQRKNATVTMCHSKSRDLADICRRADILVACVGVPKLVTESFVSSNQVVIDVGINVDNEGNLVGDVDFETVEPIVSAITPVPGGVGGITTAVLAGHIINATCKV